VPESLQSRRFNEEFEIRVNDQNISKYGDAFVVQLSASTTRRIDSIIPPTHHGFILPKHNPEYVRKLI